MQVWAIIYDPDQFSDDLFQAALRLVDSDSVARIKRFYKREDACRTLLGRLLMRMLLHDSGIAHDAVTLGFTSAKKPYILEPVLSPPIALNITHDNGVIAMAFAPGTLLPPAYSVGVDVMKLNIPRRNSFRSFVEGVSDALTALEYRLLFDNVSQEEGLRRFFWIWTMKEAYTKALGLGLGFEFKRVEYNVPQEILMVDGKQPKGWEFFKFTLSQGTETYLGVTARYVGTEDPCRISQLDPDSLVEYQGATFAKMAIERLGGKERAIN